jgi:tRNA (mo5U34)-methyltransferase
MIVKHMKIGATGLTVTVGDRVVEMIRSNILYRLLVRPIRHLLSYLKVTKENDKERRNPVDMFNDKHETMISDGTAEQKALLQRIADVEWYHSIDLGHGVITPGLFDHRPLLSHYHLPEELTNQRVLDVATYDGFWAFEFERRGAAEVVAMDIETWNEIDIPPRIRTGAAKEMLEKKTGEGFSIARDTLGSKTQRKIMNVYNLTPEWMGKFDMVFCSDLLLHLMNPMKALQNIHSVVSGYAYIVDVYDPEFGEDESDTILRYIGGSDRMVWWRFGFGSLAKMIKDAGFRDVQLVNKFKFGLRGGEDLYWHAVFKAYP